MPRFLLILLAFPAIAAAQLAQPVTPKTPPSTAALDSITLRGRTLYMYDQIAWHGSDAILALHPSEDPGRDYAVQQRADGWVLLLGRLSPR